MTRLLIWNIQNFTQDKIDDPNDPGNSQDRFNHIVGQVFSGNLMAIPDIFVVLEAGARTSAMLTPGSVMDAGSPGGAGLLLLLSALQRAGAGAGNWSLVPPIPSGETFYREGVAVFFNSSRLDFIGPYVHSGANTAVPLGTAVSTPYDGGWAGCLPADEVQVTPAVRLAMNRMAGQWSFPGLTFPNVWNRSPFLTQFYDKIGLRTISLYSVHTSPDTAGWGVHRLGSLPFPVLAGNNVNVVAGDFNVDVFDQVGVNAHGVFNPLLLLGFELLLSPTNPPGLLLPVVPSRMGYCGTHLLPTGLASPRSDAPPPPPQSGPYPRFGYLSKSSTSALPGAIDNVLVQRLPAAPAPTVSIVNRIVGVPYVAAPPPPGVTPELTGGPQFSSVFTDRHVLALPNGASGPAAATLTDRFRQPPNYARIYATSDHLAVMATF